MNVKLLSLVVLCLISVTANAQNPEWYEFKPVQQLKRQHGLQDPFLKWNGERVSTKEEWAKQRDYIKSMLAHYQYGEMPPTPKDVVVKETLSEEIYDGTAIRKLYTLSLNRNGKTLDLHFGLIKPPGKGPFPVIIKNDRAINQISDEINRDAIKRGYILCQYVRTDLSLDDKKLELTKNSGVFPLYPEYDWGTIAAWAWGYQLIIDYFETLDFIDMAKIVVTGHSRGGKTAFCGGIYDERIAITAPNSSGLGGTASHRYFELGQDEQTIGHASIANRHWWTSEYFKLAGFESRIPFDTHFGKAIIAPRAFFNAHALQDYWANPFGTFLTFEAAKNVYKWMGVENNIKMHWRTGGHAQGIADWKALLDFSDYYFYKKKVESNLDINPYPTIKVPVFWEVPVEKTDYQILPFGEGGQIKMLYDRRQRPQSVYLNGNVHLVINAGGEKGASGKSKTKPMLVSYDLASGKFSDIVTLGPAKSDHHYAPVIWADGNDYLHVLYGCHKTPGTHLISKKAGNIGSSLADWKEAPQIATSISYPTFYRMVDDKELIYYRTAGHISSWTYRTSDDNGMNWSGPENDVTDLDSKGRFEWSSYQCKLPSKDGRFLHVVFTAYDDNRQREPERYYNPRYKKAVSNEWKYNLYYVKIDLQTDEVYNFDGEKMTCPIDLDQANEKCIIWDTEGRGAGVPPDIVIDQNDNPAFLHVLSEETTEQHNYYFVHRAKGKWEKRVIAPSNHQWNSCHINLDKNGLYHAYLVVGNQYVETEWVEGRSEGDHFEKGKNSYLDTGGYMDKHGGGRIEEWVSSDNGNSWKKLRELTPDSSKYPGWKFNNIQAVTNPDGSVVEGMLLFYGWKDKDAPEAKAFLLIDNKRVDR